MNKALFLGDCIVTHAEKEFEGQLDSVFIQIQGGGSFNPESFNFDEYDHFFLLNSWANAASVIEDEAVWSDRINHQIKILTAIAETKMPFLIIDRPGVCHRYIDKNFRSQIDDGSKELGIPQQKALDSGWRVPNRKDQKYRRDKYLLLIEDLIKQFNNIFYIDMQKELSVKTVFQWSSEVNHKGGVINEAPWHFDMPYYDLVFKICLHFIKNKNIKFNISNHIV